MENECRRCSFCGHDLSAEQCLCAEAAPKVVCWNYLKASLAFSLMSEKGGHIQRAMDVLHDALYFLIRQQGDGCDVVNAFLGGLDTGKMSDVLLSVILNATNGRSENLPARQALIGRS